jgi:3alpha(or 20beta)-hydroxysteroid dehydrogenase
MGKLDGITAIITGAASGQGSAEARVFHAEGAEVVVADLEEEAGRAIVDELGTGARFQRLDVSRTEDWVTLVKSLAGGAPARALVNNAGIHWARPIEQEVEADVLRMWGVNLLGPFLGIRALVPVMREARGGSIVNVSSTAGLTGIPYLAAYSASKWGLRGLTKTSAVELAQYGIRVNSIHPGPIDTPMLRKSPTYTQRRPEERFTHVPLGRAGTDSEVASLALFLASSDSSFITGAEVAIDGGMTAGRPGLLPPPSSSTVGPLDHQLRGQI